MSRNNRKIIVMGEALIDFVPKQKGMALKDVTEYSRFAGGAPANVAVRIGQLGGHSSFVGQVGSDSFGEHIKEVLEKCQVDTTNLLSSPVYPTALAFVTLDENGERDFVFIRHQSADLMIRREDVNNQIFEQGYLFHLGSNLLMQENGYQCSFELVKEAKKQGLLISYDPNLRPLLWPEQKVDKQKVLSIMPHADIVKLSEEELFFLTDTEVSTSVKAIQESAQRISALGPSIVLITLGEKGCFYIFGKNNKGELIAGEVESIPVQVVDTTGAGDAFMGAFLYQLEQSKLEHIADLATDKLESVIRFANVQGAKATTHYGAIQLD